MKNYEAWYLRPPHWWTNNEVYGSFHSDWPRISLRQTPRAIRDNRNSRLRLRTGATESSAYGLFYDRRTPPGHGLQQTSLRPSNDPTTTLLQQTALFTNQNGFKNTDATPDSQNQISLESAKHHAPSNNNFYSRCAAPGARLANGAGQQLVTAVPSYTTAGRDRLLPVYTTAANLDQRALHRTTANPVQSSNVDIFRLPQITDVSVDIMTKDDKLMRLNPATRGYSTFPGDVDSLRLPDIKDVKVTVQTVDNDQYKIT